MRPYPSYPTRKGGDFFNLQIQPEVVFASERSERAKLQAASRKLRACVNLSIDLGSWIL
jgi:hypothetical protein